MNEVFPWIFEIAVVGFFVWLFIPTRKSSTDDFIDPDNSYQIGMLVGLTGGSIPDAAQMRFALQRFQEIHGRRATTRDIGVVLGLIHSSK